MSEVNGSEDEGEGAATIGAHFDEEGGNIAVGGEDVLVVVEWGSVFDLFGNREALDLLTTVESLYIVELMGLGNLKRTSRRSVSFGYDSNLGSSS
ncbi:hypothetical protein MRB53_014441 [Persea americana]|uniref:Uncharacterized protein n=1 Tax=Persea americana TaxID=3435 RepID=A0ACC2KAV6_PERAE|nr:hypothetical protein MRB53_014441 [Persea americana]